MDYDNILNKKQQLDRCRPFKSEVASYLDNWFKIELSYTSNAIAGNNLSRNNVALIIEKDCVIPNKSLAEHLEINNHVRALDFIKKQINRKPSDIKEVDILKLHSIFSNNLDKNNCEVYRKVENKAGIQIKFPCPKVLIWQLKATKLHPIELAAEAYFQITQYRPFNFANGQVARLLMNMIFIMEGYPPVVITKKEHLNYIDQPTGMVFKNEYLELIVDKLDKSLDICLDAVNNRLDNKSNKNDGQKLLKIGELAKLAKVRNSTIRHWTKEGLIDIEKTTDSGYQIYGQNIINKINKIKDLKEKRFTLDEIKKKLG